MIHSPYPMLLGAVAPDTAVAVFNVAVSLLALVGLAALLALAAVGVGTLRNGVALSRHEARTRHRRRMAPPIPSEVPRAAPVVTLATPTTVMPAASPAPIIDDGIAPEIIALLSAAVVAVCGPAARIRQISLVHNDAAASSWTERGRSRIHQSHRLLRGHR